MRKSFLLSTMWISFLILLTACGGGGGGGGDKTTPASSSSVAPLVDQSVIFPFANVNMTAGDTLAFLASAQGTGKIAYASSNTNVATINMDGRVTGVAAGTTTITATIAADAIYKSASASYTLTVKQLASQTVTFDQSGPLTVVEGDVIVNVAQGPGTGDLTYSSNNEEIATVNNQGYVTAVKTGAAIITAKKNRDQQYYDGQASFTINVTPTNKFTLNAWVGVNDTLLSVPTAAGATLYSSESPLCNVTNYSNCINSSLDIVSNQPITTTAATLSKTGYFILSKNAKESSLAISKKLFSYRVNQQIVSYKNQIFLFGGRDADNNRLNDVWSSPDGRVWRLLTQNAHFDKLSNHKIVVFNDRLWAIAGKSENHSDIWSSVDGINWKQEVAETPFSARRLHQIVTFDNKLWLVGGYDGTNFKNDVWTSEDGINWSLLTVSATFVADRTTVTGNGFGSVISPDQLIVFENKLWLFRSWMNSNTPAELWSSTNGKEWEKIAAPQEAINRWNHQVVAHKGRMLIISGQMISNSGVIYSSMDGMRWEREYQTNHSENITDHTIITHMNQLLSFGGATYETDNLTTNVLQSADGKYWKKLTPYADFPARSETQAVSFNNQLWVIGGGDKNDVWSSINGITWKESIGNNMFSKKWNSPSLVTFKNKIWAVGGSNFDDNPSEVWSSPDGNIWTQETAQAEFSRRRYQQVVVHNNQLWLYGGLDDSGILNDVWVSPDGVNWTRKVENAPFPGRVKSALISYNNRLWLIGGHQSGKRFNDVWSSADGITWTEETTAAEFNARSGHQVVAFDNKLWLSGGDANNDEFENDIWNSVDGIHWVLQNNHGAFNGKMEHKMLVHNNTLFIIGGAEIYARELFYSRNTNEVWSSSNGIDWRLGLYDSFRFSD
ncbi:MAG: hypothetical protein B0W54_16600 [Cellvibrio sp. 79]|nr:MAG: hypothetical protein B0W54_16600 [Cellvibrio sp. 79]